MFKLVKRYTFVSFITLVWIFWGDLSAQSDYLISLANGQKTDDNTFEFDVLLRSSLTPFLLTSYQCAFSFNQALLNNGECTFSVIPGSSELTELRPSESIGIMAENNQHYMTFASLAGEEIINSSLKKIGRFKLYNSVPFNEGNLNIKWGFLGNARSIITGTGFNDITNQLNHIYSISSNGTIHYPVINAFASSADFNSSAYDAVDGFGFQESELNPGWVVETLPQWIVFDLGAVRSVHLLKLSFMNFQDGITYAHNISFSNDAENWSGAISEAASSHEEWTEHYFDNVDSRYIKLEILYPSNGQGNPAGIWEAEIWGSTVVSSSDDPEILPESFSLTQNYPNPFNPSTQIQFSIKEKSLANLAIYNLLGEKVRILFDGEVEAGNHTVLFNADELPSGVYFYKLIVPDKFSDVKKMLLIK
ncbi:MAG: T9SS type A sorting domain-containing protein [Ignavibacteriales bacterium]|nr:MAG: T9SS type A sorting domain-containing protein [Ignavibacteriales bacterium]